MHSILNETMNSEPGLYQCPKEAIHYENHTSAKQCETFCKAHNWGSLAITKLSVEGTQA